MQRSEPCEQHRGQGSRISMLDSAGWLEKRGSDVETHKSALKPPSHEGLPLPHHCAAENLLPARRCDDCCS